MSKKLKIIVSGGGTGGHIFPALSIANALKAKDAETDIMFVGALGRMEMEKVPAAGYPIMGLPIAGLQRSLSLKNLSFPFKLMSSMRKARKIIKEFKPDVVVGVGGYASGPTLRAASKMGVPTLLQEQNSYAGLTNKLLAKKAKTICVAYENMERYFPKEKILLTGNPVRKDIIELKQDKEEGLKHFGLEKDKKVILIVGGSLGARTLNHAVIDKVELLAKEGIQVIWQTGKYYFDQMKAVLDAKKLEGIKVMDFIARMDLAYSAADIIISRAGAGTISELCIVGKPVILVPSPNVSEDHQTKNAMALVNKNAAIHIADANAVETLVPELISLSKEDSKLKELAENIKKLALPNSSVNIANEVLKLVK